MPLSSSSASYYSGQRRHSRQRRLAKARQGDVAAAVVTTAPVAAAAASPPSSSQSSSACSFSQEWPEEAQPLLPSDGDEDRIPVFSAVYSAPHASSIGGAMASASSLAAGLPTVAPVYHHHQRVPLLNSPDLQLRFLNPGDVPEIKRLCKEWFPIDYPDAWYGDITSNPKFYSVAAVFHSRIVGLVVAEIKDIAILPKEDSEILAPTFGSGTKIGYILSLGVVREYRKQGVASFLLDNLISRLTSADHLDVRAVYLHVLTTNFQVWRHLRYMDRGA